MTCHHTGSALPDRPTGAGLLAGPADAELLARAFADDADGLNGCCWSRWNRRQHRPPWLSNTS